MNDSDIKKTDINNNVLTITMEDGKVIDANILFTFNENGDQYIVYEIEHETDNEIEYVAYAAKLNDDNSIEQVNEDEWPIIEKIFNEWMEENN